VAERWDSLRDTARAAGATVTLLPVDDLGEEAGAAAAARLLERRDAEPLPDALACANDELALGVIHALRRAGVDVPATVQVTGWDDVMAARYAALTTVRQPMRELGATAARALDDAITGRRAGPRHELLPTELVVRGSTRATTETP
jgi:LacI family transcriptional regulator